MKEILEKPLKVEGATASQAGAGPSYPPIERRSSTFDPKVLQRVLDGGLLSCHGLLLGARQRAALLQRGQLGQSILQGGLVSGDLLKFGVGGLLPGLLPRARPALGVCRLRDQ